MPRKYAISEWSCTVMMLGIAVCIFFTPRTIEMGSFRAMVAVGFTPLVLFMAFLMAGTLRIVALYANGRWAYGWIARLVGAVTGSFVWFQMAWALILLTRDTGTLSVGIPVYLCLTMSEAISCYRIAADHYRLQGTADYARRFGGPS